MMTETITPVKPLLEITPTDLAQIEKYYTLRNSAQVLEFLDKYPFLVPLLSEAPEKINQYFPGDSLVLEFVIDPESESSDDGKLVLLIITEMDDDLSIHHLGELDYFWWLKVARHSQGKLFIDLE
jgi:hypothetical protein